LKGERHRCSEMGEFALKFFWSTFSILWGTDRLSLNMENPAITNFINKFSLNHSISMNIHNSLKSLHFHITLSWIPTKNWWLWLDRFLWTSSCCETWLSRYGYRLWTGRFWDSAGLDSVLDCLSERCS
jgi:hypothetical protein